MDTRIEMENELLSQIQASANSSLFPRARLTQLIQNAYVTATTLFKWLALADAKTTDTTNKGTNDDVCYYDQPPIFRTNTIFRVQIDGKEYNRKSYTSFLDFRNRYSSTTNLRRIFALHQKYIFISPDTVAGTDNMDIWGITNADPLTDSTSETIFTGSADACNMAVVSLALSTAMKKINPKLSASELANALAILGKVNSDEWDEYAKDQQLDTPLFDVPDFFGSGNLNNRIGQFNVDLPERY